jgi:hypothetical protein
MYEIRIKELDKIKKEKAAEIDRLNRRIEEVKSSLQIMEKQKEVDFAKLNQLNMQLRIKIDEHNRAAWIIEEYEKLKESEVQDE